MLINVEQPSTIGFELQKNRVYDLLSQVHVFLSETEARMVPSYKELLGEYKLLLIVQNTRSELNLFLRFRALQKVFLQAQEEKRENEAENTELVQYIPCLITPYIDNLLRTYRNLFLSSI